MCGITGILDLNKAQINLESLKAMNKAIAHRGPDGDGFWVHCGGFLGFGHRRLSILDLTNNGSQPMHYADSKLTITFNGEIFNFIELREELEGYGYKFNSDSDTEVVLASYYKWGIDCLSRFNGMWAFAIWDEQEQSLFLARDHFGIKPLYYMYKPNQVFVFGSETNQFKYIEGCPRQFDYTRLVACIQNPFYQEGQGETIYKGIQSILPGHYILIKDKKVEQMKWWDTYNYPVQVSKEYNEQVEQFKSLFFDSCKLRLRSDVPIASALSGGLDSSSVYCTLYHLLKHKHINAERMPEEWQKAFVGIFPDTEQDETNYAKMVIKHVNGAGVFVDQNFSNLADDIVTYTQKLDTIYSTPIHVMAKVYESMRNNGIIVSMDGHGVDEMMYGYPWPLPAVIEYFKQNDDTAYADDLLHIYVNLFHESNRNVILKKQIDKGIKSSANPILKRVLGRIKNTIYSNQNQTSPWLHTASINITTLIGLESMPQRLRPEIDLYKQFHQSPLPVILRNFDKASMMSGIEIRMPFMDHRLVSMVFQLPIQSKLGGGYTKRILRDSMKGILPEDIRTRTNKIGFLAPLKEWMDHPLKNFVLDTVSSASFQESSYWNGKQIKKDVEAHYLQGKRLDYNQLWKVINAQIILQHNK
jgi:asparagine synthase (glutamine-hydrolysing)